MALNLMFFERLRRRIGPLGVPSIHFGRWVPWLLGGVLLAVSSAVGCYGAVISASSPSRNDVAAALASAVDGDTIDIPAGTAQWTSVLRLDKAVTLRGAGIGRTVIQDSVSSGGTVMLVLLVPGKVTRVSGIEFENGTRSSAMYDGSIAVYGNNISGGRFRIDNCKLDRLQNFSVTLNDALGVIDHCQFEFSSARIGIYVFHSGWNGQNYGDGSWATPTDWNGTNWVVVEDCSFNNTGAHYAVIDSYRGARWIFRYNSVSNGWCEAHGTESGQRFRGTRAIQVYGNRFYANNAGGLQVNVRSGSALIFSNTASGFLVPTVATLATYRAFWPFTPWGGADGTNAWDTNVPGGPFATGTHTGASGSAVVVDSSKNWTPNQWVGYSVQNVTTRRHGEIFGNTATTLTVSGSGGYGPNITFAQGDTYQIWKVAEAVDQTGKGQGDALWGDYPSAKWLNQVDEPVYEWGNLVNGANGRLSAQASFIRAGEHYFEDTVKPGFVPMAYPHPLVSTSSLPPSRPSAPSRDSQGDLVWSSSPSAGRAPLVVDYTAMVPTNVAFSVDFGDGVTSSQTSGSHEYRTSGTYRIRVSRTVSGVTTQKEVDVITVSP